MSNHEPAVQVATPTRSVAELAALLEPFEDVPTFSVDDALAAAEEVQREADALGEIALSMRARLLAADVADRRGRIHDSVRTLWEVNAWADEQNHGPLQARSHLLLAKAFENLGDQAACLEHSVAALEALGDAARPRSRAYYLIKLADALSWSGSMDAARERYRQAEQLATVVGDLEVQRMACNNLAYAEFETGSPDLAWAAAERMVAVAAADGRTPDTNELDTIACIHIALGRYAEAEAAALRAVDEYQTDELEEADALAEYLLTLAIARRHLGATDLAQADLDASRVLCEARELAETGVRVLQEQAELHAARGEFDLAFAVHKEFTEAAEDLRAEQREARARTRQAMFETAEARRDAEQAREQARRDPLTGLRNRRFVDENLPVLLADAGLTGAPVSLALIDLDHFKRINDSLSHDVGDQVLVATARLLDAAVPEPGFVARMGGEEFLVVLPGVGLTDAADQLDDVRQAVRSHPWRPVTGELPVTVSIGVTCTDTIDGRTPAALLSDADRNLYAAKDGGRDQVTPAARQRYRA